MIRFAPCAVLALFICLVLTPTLTTPSTAIAFSTVAAADDTASAGSPPDADSYDDDSFDEDDDAAIDDEDDLEDDDDDIDVDDDEDDADFEDEDEEEEDDEDDAAEEASAPDEDKPAVIDPEGKENDSSYNAPSIDGAVFADTFQSGLSKWAHSSISDYNGKFVIGQGANPTFAGDRALIIPEKARKYGLSATISGLDDMAGRAVVIQYEVKLDQSMTCGGAYVKLPLPGFETGSFDGSTPYSIMFGPDKCGSTDKVHFIFQSRNPKTGKMSEHHLKNPPSVANSYDKKTHLYAVYVGEDGSFKVHVDGEQKVKGTLSESFDPPVQPPQQIDDPEDKKPSDWVDTKKIPDPKATKPDDWDEDAPAQIVDEDATKPDGWLDDEPEKIADPKAEKPEEWDDEEDGEWEAPKISNPKCEEVGCGEWKKPMKANPDYKGKWKAPMIDNPDYIGEWKPKKIDNPDYYEVEKVQLLGIGGIGFEIWTMDQGVLFDNVWVGSDWDAAEKFANETFIIKQKTELDNEEKARAEKEKKKSEKKKAKSASGKNSLGPVMDRVEEVIDKMEAALAPVEIFLQKNGMEVYLNKLVDMGVKKPMLVVVSIPLMMVLIILILLSGGSKKESQPSSSEATGDDRSTAESKKTDAVTEDAGEEEDTTKEKAGEEEVEKKEGITESGIRKRATATAE